MTDDEKAIRAFVDEWFAASRSGDVDAILRLMDEDAVFMSPGAEPFGAQAFKAAAAQMKNMKIDMASDIQEIKILGDWAIMRNRLELTVAPPGAKPIRRAGHTLTILRRTEDGRWVLSRDANMLV
ncbi:SgcJ/EcaC family oxidoreductase [Methylocystis sp. WRRC1]|uniref:YybH family protein n=1 Tax=unclassified Methylocystis TaxID=2625913 RepID=UPI0001F88452|nr:MULTISPECIES: SgcJ/EcaC family oxidoreductase [unclassified Methylocystis]MCC3246502.1 SgcJ/EcaC family oxidoreductase [Methylocystis sp. WRRC1]